MGLNIKELRAHKKKIELELNKAKREYNQHKGTNHILHAVVTVITMGIWGIVWFVIASSNRNRSTQYETLIETSESTLIDIQYSIDDLEHA